MQTSLDVYHRNSDRTEGGPNELIENILLHPVNTGSNCATQWLEVGSALHKQHTLRFTQAMALLEGAVLLVMQGKEVNQMWPWKNAHAPS